LTWPVWMKSSGSVPIRADRDLHARSARASATSENRPPLTQWFSRVTIALDPGGHVARAARVERLEARLVVRAQADAAVAQLLGGPLAVRSGSRWVTSRVVALVAHR